MDLTDPIEALTHEFAEHYSSGFDREGPLVYFADMGSVMVFGPNNADDLVAKIRAVLVLLRDTANGGWCWDWEDTVEFDSPHGRLRGKLAPDHAATPVDFRRQLWINFDSKDDALLSRMTIVDLRNARHANSGGLSTHP